MIEVEWSAAARRDLSRLYDFLRDVNPRAAAAIIRQLNSAAKSLATFPERGASIESYLPLNIRRLLIDDYEMRYEVQSELVRIIRLWHTREDR